MQISQIAAVDFSTIQFADNHAVETVSQTGDEFSAYLARIIDPQDQQVPDDRREEYHEISNDPDGYSRITDVPKEQKPTRDDSMVEQKESALVKRGAGAAKQSIAAGSDGRGESGAGAEGITDLKAASARRSARSTTRPPSA